MEKFNQTLTEEAEKNIKICLDRIERCNESLSRVQYNEDIKKVYLDMISNSQNEILEWKRFIERI